MKRTPEELAKKVAAYHAKEELKRSDMKMARMAEESLAFCDGLVALIVQKGIITQEEMNALPSISQEVRTVVEERKSLREIVRAEFEPVEEPIEEPVLEPVEEPTE